MAYSKASVEMVEAVADQVKKNHQHLDGFKIAVLRRDVAARRGGKVILATASRPSKKLAPLLDEEYSFVITIASDEWEMIDEKQRDALIDHELCHCRKDDKGKPKLVSHDIEEFACIIRRHGMWQKTDLEELVVEALLFRQGVTVEAPDPKKPKAKSGEEKAS